MTQDIGPWLAAIGLPQYAQAFRANDIDATQLPGLTAEDLKEIGVASLGHRKTILDAIFAAREAQESGRRVDRAGAGPSAVLLALGLLQAGELDAAQAAATEAIALCRYFLRANYEAVAHGVLARAYWLPRWPRGAPNWRLCWVTRCSGSSCWTRPRGDTRRWVPVAVPRTLLPRQSPFRITLHCIAIHCLTGGRNAASTQGQPG